MPGNTGKPMALSGPKTDPTPIFELFRGTHATELLTAAVTHFKLFDKLAARSLNFSGVREALGLSDRAANVLLTAVRAFGLLTKDEAGCFGLSPLAREHLVSGAEFDVSGYVALAGQSPSVQAMVERLTSDQPAASAAAGAGAAFIYREGIESAMENSESARFLTMSLAGRARNVAPFLAERISWDGVDLLLDVAGGSGIYSVACLRRCPKMRAIVWDRPEVLRVAAEMAARHDVADRLECVPGDMFRDPVPKGAQAILLSNVLHDWDVPANRHLIERCAAALPAGGRLLVHDVFLNDDLDGPLPVALYSAALFSLTEGRAYSAAEYRGWLRDAGLEPGDIVPTLVHCGVLPATKR